MRTQRAGQTRVLPSASTALAAPAVNSETTAEDGAGTAAQDASKDSMEVPPNRRATLPGTNPEPTKAELPEPASAGVEPEPEVAAAAGATAAPTTVQDAKQLLVERALREVLEQVGDGDSLNADDLKQAVVELAKDPKVRQAALVTFPAAVEVLGGEYSRTVVQGLLEDPDVKKSAAQFGVALGTDGRELLLSMREALQGSSGSLKDAAKVARDFFRRSTFKGTIEPLKEPLKSMRGAYPESERLVGQAGGFANSAVTLYALKRSYEKAKATFSEEGTSKVERAVRLVDLLTSAFAVFATPQFRLISMGVSLGTAAGDALLWSDTARARRAARKVDDAVKQTISDVVQDPSVVASKPATAKVVAEAAT